MSAPLVGEPVPCTHRVCGAPPTRRITNATGRSWYGCEPHWAEMADALHWGQPIEASVTVERWPRS